MEGLSDQDLLRRVWDLDTDALSEAYDRYSTGIYRYAMRLLGDNSLAEDCVSESFSRLLEALRLGRGPHSHLKAYLYRIAHNWITDHYRASSAREFPLDESLPDADGKHVEWETERELEKEEVRRALWALSSEQRLVIVLRYVEGWETEQVAAAVNKSPGAIRGLQHRALRTLRKHLSDEEEEDTHETAR